MTNSFNFINSSNLCSGCGACIQVCPRNCISMSADEDGFDRPSIDFAACVNCGACKRACPYSKNAFHIGGRTGPLFFAARMKEKASRLGSSSGGAFRAFSGAVLGRGGAVAGVRFDSDFRAELTIAETLEARDEFCLSKYVQSRNERACRDVKSFLKAGRPVLFSGAPCQVAGLYGFLGSDHENLYTMDFICHGVPSPLVFAEYRKSLERRFSSRVKTLNFRDKSEGWVPMRLRIEFENGAVYSKTLTEDPFFRMFLSGGISRPECYICPYARTDCRESDLTLGDAWRAEVLDSAWRDNTGVSTLLVNSPKGEALLKETEEDLDFRKCDFSVIDQHYLHHPGILHPDRNAFFHTFRKKGIDAAMDRYSGPRPLLRRLKTRFLKIIRRLSGKGNPL